MIMKSLTEYFWFNTPEHRAYINITDDISKVVAKSGWFAARPSGTEEIYKIYTESFLGADHLKRIQDEAQAIVGAAFAAAGV